MTAVLILLALLSFGAIASRRGFARELVQSVEAPLLVIAGWALLSPNGLAFLEPATADSLVPALRVGCAWLGLMFGLSTRYGQIRRRRISELSFAFGASVWCWLLIGAAVFVVARSFDVERSEQWAGLTPFGAALLIGALVEASDAKRVRAGLRSGFIGVAALCAALLLFPPSLETAPLYRSPLLAIGALLLLTALLVIVQILMTRSEQQREMKVIALIGMAILLTGVAASVSLPEIALAYLSGVALSWTATGRDLRRWLAPTEQTVRVAVLVLAGVHLSLDAASLAIGGAAAVARFVAKWTVLVGARRSGVAVSLQQLLAGSKLAIPLAVSFTFAERLSPGDSSVFGAVVGAVALTDLLFVGFAATQTARRERSGRAGESARQS